MGGMGGGGMGGDGRRRWAEWAAAWAEWGVEWVEVAVAGMNWGGLGKLVSGMQGAQQSTGGNASYDDLARTSACLHLAMNALQASAASGSLHGGA